MEAIALLCTLHADGPATLRRLRASGCDSLEALESMPALELSELLRSTPAVARRLAREARILRQRVAEDPLEREEAPEGMTRGASVDTTFEAEFTESVLDEADQELLSRVLDTPSVETTGPLAGPEPEIELEIEPEPEIVASEPAVLPELEELSEPEPLPEPVQLTRLRAADLDGLDEELCLQLAQQEIRDLAGLAGVDCDSLAQATGRSFAQLRRLQFLAQRSLPGEPTRLAPRPAFGAGLGSLQPQEAPIPAPEPVQEVSTTPEPQPEPQAGPAPFGANVEARVIPTRERLEAPGMELPVPAPAPPSPRRFWEPRSLYEARTTRSGAAQTPASLTPVERAGLAPAQAPAPAQQAPVQEASEASTEKPLVLSWDFEIPTPGRAPEPAPPADQTPGQAGQREGAAGPFA